MIPKRQLRAKAELGRYMTRRERRCLFKRVHTAESAEHEAQRLRDLGETTARAYVCDNCEQWHVGRLSDRHMKG